MVDLHMHSRYSDDGEFSPSELVRKCSDAGIKIMSITDHNCVRANVEAAEAAKARNICYIPGIEIDCTFRDINFHMLGYGIDYKSNDFTEIERNIEEQSIRTSMERLVQTQVLGFHVTENDMWEIAKDNYWKDIWTGEMFAEVLLSRPEYADHPLLKPYRPGGSRGDNPYVNFYWDYYAQGKSCYAEEKYPGMEDILDVIHANGGFAVLAHPWVNLNQNIDLLDEILDLGPDGVEAFSSYHTREQAEFFYGVAKERNLIVTCGSDYHGKTKPAIQVGQHHCRLSWGDI